MHAYIRIYICVCMCDGILLTSTGAAQSFLMRMPCPYLPMPCAPGASGARRGDADDTAGGGRDRGGFAAREVPVRLAGVRSCWCLSGRPAPLCN